MKRSQSILRATSKKRRNYWWLSETELERPQIATDYGVILLAAAISRGQRNFLIWKQKRIYCRKKDNW